MAGRLPLRPLVASIVLTAAVANAAPNRTRQPDSPDAMLAKAAAAEKAGDWEKALELNLQAYLAGRQTPEVRDRIADCNRFAAQLRRHRDPVFRQHALALAPADALNLYAEALDKLAAVHVDRDRATPAKLFLSGIDEFDRALGNPTFRRDHLPDAGDASVAKFRTTLRDFWKLNPPRTVRDARTAAIDLIRIAQTELGVKAGAAVVLELLCGACHSLDEYTVYLSPTEASSEAAGLTELAAYGLAVSVRRGQLVIDRVSADGWAGRNTLLRAGDRIARVNGRTPMTPAALTDALRQPPDGAHEVEVAGDVPTVVRLPTPLPTVQEVAMLSMKDGVGYVRLAAFSETTLLELDAAVMRLKDQGMRSLVLDLRGNAGGHFLSGVRVAERFLPTGVIATTESPVPEFAGRVFSSDSGMTAYEFPVVVLIDTKTLSAAEVVAAALKEQNRATVVGLPSFGKGVVQFPFKLTADGPRSGTLVLTIAKVLTPTGTPLHRHGVLPDVVEADPARQLSVAVERAAAAAGMR